MISNRSFVRCLIAGTILALSILAAAAETPTMTASKTAYAPVNGLNLYYEIYGAGEPLVLLHGGAGAIEIFSSILPDLSRNHQVIAVDLQAHGRTADIARPLSYEAMADDIADLIRCLGIEKADVMGYSLGGEVALRVAIQHPKAVRKLVLVSVAYKRSGWYPEILAAEARTGPEVFEQMKQTPMYQLYQRTAPRPSDWPVLLGKLNRLLTQDYDWSSEVTKMQTPTLLVFGDADAVRPAHTVEFFELLGGGKRDGGWDGSGMSNVRLAIIPGITHYTIFSSPAMTTTVVQFLDAGAATTK
jgi:pimeloyl-ACP methyl ester carboxylesterase